MGWTEAFLEAMIAERGAARNTLLAYRRDLADFAGWLRARSTSLQDAGRHDIEAYLADLETAGLAATTRARRLSAIRQLYRFALTEGWRETDPAARLQGPRPPRKLPGTLTVAEIDRLLDACRCGEAATARERRLHCLVELLYATGMRVSELVSLPVIAVRGDPRMVLVHGKGGRERMVPLSDPARAALRDWLSARDTTEAKARARASATWRASSHLFPSAGKTGHLTRIRFYQMLKDVAVRAGIEPHRVSPHTLRHAFATHLLANGADLRVIQQLLGHADVSTTEIYTHVLDERLKSLVLEKHPLSQG